MVARFKEKLMKMFQVDSSVTTEADRSKYTSELLERLESLLGDRDPAEVGWIAGLAGLMGKVINIDLEISERERAHMEEALGQVEGISEQEAAVITKIACELTKELSGIEDHHYFRLILERCGSDRAQKRTVIEALYRVASAEDISSAEDHAIRKISRELMLPEDDFRQVRSMFADKLAVLKEMPS